MSHFLTPALALIIWTLVMLLVMYKRRIPAMQAISKRTQDFIDNPKLGEQMPAKARWAADNFNHLHENPTIFYALMFVIFLMDKVTPLARFIVRGPMSLFVSSIPLCKLHLIMS